MEHIEEKGQNFLRNTLLFLCSLNVFVMKKTNVLGAWVLLLFKSQVNRPFHECKASFVIAMQRDTNHLSSYLMANLSWSQKRKNLAKNEHAILGLGMKENTHHHVNPTNSSSGSNFETKYPQCYVNRITKLSIKKQYNFKTVFPTHLIHQEA